MSDSALPVSGWICPACRRRIPTKIDRCRCGAARSIHDIQATSDVVGPTRRASRLGRRLTEGALLCAMVTLAGYYFVSAGATIQRPANVAAATSEPRASRRGLRDIVVLTPPTADSPIERVAPVTRATSSDLPEPSAVPLEDLIEHALPSVVLVESTKTRGSGFFVRSGLLVTNAHVIGGAASVTVTMQNGTKVTAGVVNSSNDLDLALLATPTGATDLHLPLGASSSVRLGQGIVALGWAQDLTQSTVTRGIVTGLRRDGAQRLVQTDAVPNHGDSGGPVLDRYGAVVGVTTFRADVAGTTSGFAVAIDDVKAFIASAGR